MAKKNSKTRTSQKQKKHTRTFDIAGKNGTNNTTNWRKTLKQRKNPKIRFRSKFSEIADQCMARGHVSQQDRASRHALEPCTDLDRQRHESQTQPGFFPSYLSHAPSLWFRHTIGRDIGKSIHARHSRDDKVFGYLQRVTVTSTVDAALVGNFITWTVKRMGR